MLKIYDLSIDNVINPSLTKTRDLRFGWKLDSDKNNVVQTSYILKISNGDEMIFNSGEIFSSENFDVVFNDLVLPSRSYLTLTVEVCDSHSERATASVCFSTEILPDEWGDAVWIKPSEHIIGWAPYMRTKFTLGKVKRAVMYASGLGVAEYYVNGKKTDDYYIDPPFTNYEKTVFYRRYDITDMLCEGGNAICVLLGEGFYSQSRVWGYDGFYYGDVCAKIRVEITLTDGTQKVIYTNTKDWKYKYSPITVNNIYGGETYDCRLETPDFCEYDGSEVGWGDVAEDNTPKGELSPCLIPPVRAIRELPAKEFWPCSGKGDGAWIFDIGENIAGIAEFHIPRSPRGAVYVFRYTETINGGKNLDQRSIGASATQCIQQDIYVCRGDENGEIYRPRLCYHGFRYIEMTGFHDFTAGYGTQPKLSFAKGIQVSTDFTKTGDVSTSHNDLNTLFNMMNNTFRSNYHGFPEDCPARERCGWLGDAQVCVNYGLLNYDSMSSYEKYLNDIRTSREVYGTWQMIAPGKRGCGEASPLWGCAQIIIPYYMYKYMGSKSVVLRNFDLMEAWVQHEINRADDYIISQGLGDWCPPDGIKHPKRMPVPHSSTLMFYEICEKMAELCSELSIGNENYYRELAEKIKNSLIRHFYDTEKHTYGYWGSDGVALMIGAYPDGDGDNLLYALLRSIEEDDFAMHTGIYANKYLFPVLLDKGYGDTALKFLFNKEHTSFSTMIDNDATTIWESFEAAAVYDDNQVMPSLNHPMHGGFLYACHESVAGIRPLTPGFKKFELRPALLETIDSVGAHIETPCGKISVSYRKNSNNYSYELEIPENTECVLNFENCQSISVNGSIMIVGDTLGSGKYLIDVITA